MSVPPATPSKALSVAAYIIQLAGEIGEPVTNMKLQKLMYYSYAWFMVFKGGSEFKLFEEGVEAWQYGPVVRNVYVQYQDRGADSIKAPLEGTDGAGLTEDERDIIREVFVKYGDKTAIQLMNLSHSETPWLNTYKESSPKEKIDDQLIFAFYSQK